MKNIYNAKATRKRKNLGSLTPFQALLRNLDRFFQTEIDDHNHILKRVTINQILQLEMLNG